ncbi:coiled-coil domain-containing protein 86-like [Dendropsophus ebraccatus]|uniref:coiled-coil domain-containing protein 86-like n=1 Tax=Dendropsophus ebraccatus TaxID=150705 RepID=UPI0038312D76
METKRQAGAPVRRSRRGADTREEDRVQDGEETRREEEEERAQTSQERRKQPEIPQGRPKSGRVWKENKKRFSSMVRDRPLRTSWELKMKQRQEKMMMRSLAQQLKDEKQQEKEEKKRRREENLKRRLENERRAEVVQVIRNPAKLKRVRKKQLRTIEKRDTLMMSQKSTPSKGTGGKGTPSKEGAGGTSTPSKEGAGGMSSST